jgi:general L-amino acid transport system permease protein
LGFNKITLFIILFFLYCNTFIIPPTTNQYLNLTKNSSLAAAIAYPDLVLVFAGTAMMQTGRAIEIVCITMATYLTISLSLSLFMNWYNKRIAIQEK